LRLFALEVKKPLLRILLMYFLQWSRFGLWRRIFGYATLFTLVLCGFLIVLGKVNFGAKKSPYKVLKVTVRDDFDYKREFEEVFNKYGIEL